MARPWIRCLIGAVFTSMIFYFYLFSNVAERGNSKKQPLADLESKKTHSGVKDLGNPSRLPISDSRFNEIENNADVECNVVQIAMVCAGYNSTFATVTVVKSIVFYRRNPLHFHLVVDEVANRTLFALFQSWDLPNVQVTYYKSAELVPQVAWIPNKHYSGVYGLLKLILPEIIGEEDKVIVLDADVTVLTDIQRLWKLFDEFGDEQVIGLVENQSDWYLKPAAINPFPWPALGRGFNTGVMLMHLKRLRSIKFLYTWRETSRGTLKFIPETRLADQDIINAVIKKYPRIVYRLECTWNVQLSVNTLSENCYTNTNEINIIHWNSPRKQDVSNKHIEDFRKAYQIFLELDGNLLRRQLFVCNERKISSQSEIAYSPCQRFEKSAGIKYRTHLFLLEYENNFKSAPDVTLITQCSADRLTLLEDLCKRWSGAISVALYFTDADTHNFINFVRGSEELKTRRNIAYHVVYKEGEFYPVNYLRNIGISHVTTTYIFQLDVDFLPSNGLYETLMSNIVTLGLNEDNKVALIVPAFETERYRFNFPPSKEALVKSLNRGVFYTFRYHIWSQGHAATNYTHWCKAAEPYEVAWEPDFEPYVVVPSSAPSYDTRFVGFGWNKVSHIAHLAAMGYRYVVLPDGFVIHRPHAPSLDIIKFRQDSLYRRCLKKLKDKFVEELLTRYQDSAVFNLNKYPRLSSQKLIDRGKLKT